MNPHHGKEVTVLEDDPGSLREPFTPFLSWIKDRGG